jgi:hypothetical protein
MKKGLWVLGLAVLGAGSAWADLPAGYQMKSDSLILMLEAPPALVYLTDGQGRKTGADPSKALNPDGSQGPKNSGLSEIPLSQVVQTAMAAQAATPVPNASELSQTPTPSATALTTPSPAPAASTGWTLSVLDGGSQTYSVYLKGVAFGVAGVKMSGSFKGTLTKASNSFGVLVSPGKTRQVNVIFDTDGKSIGFKPVASARDLADDVQIAAKLKLITSARAVGYLCAQANAAQGGFRNVQGGARHHLELFLHAIGESRPPGCTDENDSADVSDPVRKILTDEAQAVLDTLPASVTIQL